MHHKKLLALAILVMMAVFGRVEGDFIEGIDVSHWQGTINWTSVRNAGIEFAFTKATEGTGYVDPTFHANMRGATSAGVLIGPYHFCRIDTSTTDPLDPVNEANHFLGQIQSYYDSGLYLPPVADVEGLPDFPTLAEERAFISNWVQLFSDTINNTLGVRPIIYNSKYVANTYYTSTIATTHELWLAWWRDTGTSNPPVPSDTPLWGDWLFWQWTDDWSVPGIGGAVDGDVFDGTSEDLMQLAIGKDPNGSNTVVSITDFEVDEGYFNWSPFFSGSNRGILDGTTAERITSEAYLSTASQEISIIGDPAGWFLRHLSGIGSPPSDPATNLVLPATGSIGFWLKTEDPGITVRIAVDDPGTAERGIEKSVLADGQWHLYEWILDDDDQWEGWVNGDGIISEQTVTLDSIQFFGTGNVTLYMDSIAHNPYGSLALLEGDFNNDGDVDEDDFQAWLTGFGLLTGAVLADGDANGDGDVDGDDFLTWQQHFDVASDSGMITSAVPEPTNVATFGILLALLIMKGRKISVLSNR